MRSVAAAIDSRSAAGLEAKIAALWAIYGDLTLAVDAHARPGGVHLVGHPPDARLSSSTRHLAPTCSRRGSTRPEGSSSPTARWRNGTASWVCSAPSSGRGRTLDTPAEPAGDVEEPVLDHDRPGVGGHRQHPAVQDDAGRGHPGSGWTTARSTIESSLSFGESDCCGWT